MNGLRPEPITALTDFLLAGAAAWFALHMYRASLVQRQRGLRIWSLAFATVAIAAFLGGIWHGLRPFLYPFVERGLWFAIVGCIGIASCLLVVGTAVACTGPRPRALLVAFSGGKLVSYLAWIAQNQDYLFVMIDAVVSLLIVLTLLSRSAWAGQFGGLRLFLIGLLVGLLGATLRQLGVSPHEQFDENDLFHLIQIASLWFLYRGALQLRDVGHETASITVGDSG